MKRRFCSVPMAAAVVATLLAAVPAAVRAQDVNLQVVPKIGLYTPMNSLSDDAEAGLGLGIGVAAELILPRLPFNVRINVEHATSSDIVTRDTHESVLGSMSMTNVVGDIVLRPLPATALFQPYFLGGGGVKLYSFDITSPGSELALVTSATRRATVHVGGGFDVRFGPVALLLEISDYISTIADAAGGNRVQNDLFAMVGFRVSMF